MSLSDVIRNIAKTVTDKEKAKDLPALLVQGTLTAAGQALTLFDRLKNSLRGGDKDDKETDRPSAAEQLAQAEETKPERKEPVIFAPRPESAEPNGVAKDRPDPVIFSPAGKKTEDKPEAEAKTQPVTEAKPRTKTEPAAQSVVEPIAEPVVEPVVEPVAEPVVEPAAESVVEPVVAPEPPAATAEPAPAPEPATAPEPVAAKPVTVTEPEPAKAEAKPKPRKKPAAKKTEAAEPAGETAEPLPGFASLSVASLRARMRGKTADQIAEFLAYEQATSGRPEVIRMFENRLAKLRSGE